MKKFLGAAAALAMYSSAAAATTYGYVSPVLNGVKSTYVYDTVEEKYSMTFAVENSAGVDGAWWVISDGPNPASTGATELAIL